MDVTDTYTPLEHLVFQVIEAVRADCYRDWVPDWADKLYGDEAKFLASALAKRYVVTRANQETA